MKHSIFSYLKISLLSLLFISSVKADFLNLTGAETAQNIAEVYISGNNIVVKLELSFNNLATFEELIPDEWTKGIKRPPIKQREQNFSNKTFKVIADGKVLPVHISVAEARLRKDRKSKYVGLMNPYTKQRVKGAVKDERVLYVELVYTLDKKPKTLQIIPPLDKKNYAKVNTGFVVYHQSVPVIDFRYLNQSTKLTLDWNDPWYSRFENKNLTRHHKYPLMGYLYVEPRMVRLESLMRVDDISKLSSFKQVDKRAEKLFLLKEHVKKYFEQDKKLTINNNHVTPDAVNVSYFRVSISGLKLVENITDAYEPSLLVGVSQQYFVDRLPQDIESEWVYFNDNVDYVPFSTMDPVGPYPDFIYPDDPVFRWKNLILDKTEPKIAPVTTKTGVNLKLPGIGYTKVWDKLPNEQQSKDIIEKILENIRIAFIEKRTERFTEEFSKILSSKQHDALAEEFSKLYSPAIVRGGVGEVKEFSDIEIKNIRELNNSKGFSATVSGLALIDAKHWGHNDQLKLKYQLLIDMVEKNNQWLISDVSILDLKDSKNDLEK